MTSGSGTAMPAFRASKSATRPAAVPGSHDAFRVGATALCVRALREAGERKASARGLKYLAAYDGLRRANRAEIYNVWAHLYALETLARAWAEDKVEAYKTAAERHLKRLENVISMSVTSWHMGENGWTFEAAPGVVPDPIQIGRAHV